MERIPGIVFCYISLNGCNGLMVSIFTWICSEQIQFLNFQFFKFLVQEYLSNLLGKIQIRIEYCITKNKESYDFVLCTKGPSANFARN